MENDLSNYRKSYEKGELLLNNVPDDPIALFRNWFSEVDTYFDVGETNAMTLSTIGTDGYPKNRVVLLKKYSNDGFTFYTNYRSEKGMAIAKCPNVCLSFFWHAAERQVLIKGEAKKIDEKLSDTYFDSRPKGSQIGALVSKQSEIIKNREVLEKQLTILQKTYANRAISRPKHWGGYIVVPNEIEFWQGRPNRLHDRIRYKIEANFNWCIERLSP